MSQNSSMRRVAITGLGAICGLGHNVHEIWSKLIQGQSGISLLESANIDQEKVPVNFGGQVKRFTFSGDILPETEQRKFDAFVLFALHSANEALLDANFPINPEAPSPYPREKIGAILGVGMGGFPLIEYNHSQFLEKGARRVSPFFIPSVIPNMSSGLISIKYGFQGVNYSISSACASSAHAISASAREIMLGHHDMMVTGGAEAVLGHLSISGFSAMKALSKGKLGPEKSSRPFDQQRDGFVMGEGSGILILEDLEKAKERGAKIYAEIVGHGMSSDAHHITAPHPEGIGAVICMQQALKETRIAPECIGYINAHGTSTPLGDIAETKALKKVFGQHAYKLHVSSTKSMTGHLLGAAGGIESIFCVKALYEGILPPTINLQLPDPECDLNYIANKAVSLQCEYALNNSFGFGGTNSSLIFKKY